MKKTVKFVFIILAIICIERFCHMQTDSFALNKIQSSLSFIPEWQIKPQHDEEDVKRSLMQPFTYLGKGAQSFVFLSQDGKYVLKFFRFDHLRAPIWASQAKKKNKKERQERLFASCMIAYEELREQTGLVFLHLNKTNSLNCSIELFDKLGIKHRIFLDEYEFVLQKRAEPVYASLEKYIREKNDQKAKEAIKGLLSLLITRSQKGVFDKDPDLRSNFGFIGDKAVQIDIGRFQRKNVPIIKDELLRVMNPLKIWLQDRSPSLALFLEEEISSFQETSPLK